MFNLESILVLVSVFVSIASIWGIIYLAGRFYVRWLIKRDCGDMPSAEEIREMYEKNNAIIRYEKHPPIDKNLRS